MGTHAITRRPRAEHQPVPRPRPAAARAAAPVQTAVLHSLHAVECVACTRTGGFLDALRGEVVHPEGNVCRLPGARMVRRGAR